MGVQDVNKDYTFQVNDGVQKILQNKLQKVEGGDDLAKDIMKSINELVVNPKTTKTNKDTKQDVENFFGDIQDGIRSFQSEYEGNNQKNLNKVKQANPEVGDFLSDFDNMVEQVQNKYESKTIGTLKESYLSYIRPLNKQVLKESKQKKTKVTPKDFITQTRHQTNMFFESKGLSSQNSKYHEYLSNTTDKDFNYLQNEGKRLIITEGKEILKPYFRKNKNRFRLGKLLREGFEEPKKWVDDSMQMEPVNVAMEPIEYREEIPQWKDEQMMDDYDFQFMFLNYVDGNENIIVSNNMELEQKLEDLQFSLYNNTNDLETGWETETGIQQDIKEQDGETGLLKKMKNYVLKMAKKIKDIPDESTKEILLKDIDKLKDIMSPGVSEDLKSSANLSEQDENEYSNTSDNGIESELKRARQKVEELEQTKKERTQNEFESNNTVTESESDDYMQDYMDVLEDEERDLMDVSDKELDNMIDELMQKKAQRKESRNKNESKTYNEIISDPQYDVGDGQRLEISDEITDPKEITNFFRSNPQYKGTVDTNNITSFVTITNDMGDGHNVEQFFYSKDTEEPMKYEKITAKNLSDHEDEKQKKRQEQYQKKNEKFGDDLK